MASCVLTGRLSLFGVDVVVDLGGVVYRHLVGGGVVERVRRRDSGISGASEVLFITKLLWIAM